MIVVSRRLGAALVSVFMSLRLVASIAGSAVLLGEVPSSALCWAGFGLIIAVMTAFLGLVWWSKRREAAAAIASDGSSADGASKGSAAALAAGLAGKAAAGGAWCAESGGKADSEALACSSLSAAPRRNHPILSDPIDSLTTARFTSTEQRIP